MVDQEKIKKAVKLLLEGIGEDGEREGLLETPDRIARMYGEICGGMEADAAEVLSKTFATEKTEMVLEKDIVFSLGISTKELPAQTLLSIAFRWGFPLAAAAHWT